MQFLKRLFKSRLCGRTGPGAPDGREGNDPSGKRQAPIGGHVSYWYWGPRDYTGECMIVLGDDRRGVERWFDQVEAVADVGHPYAMAQEHFTVFLCRKPKGWTLQEIWPRLKKWD